MATNLTQTSFIYPAAEVPVGSLQKTPATTPLIAQQFNDNLFNNFQGTFNQFVESGQVWALLIGILLGYLIRSLTAY